jgi:hypothetical protein
MKNWVKKLAVLGVVLITVSSGVYADTLLNWNLSSAPDSPVTYNSTTTADGLEISTLSRGSGASASTGGASFRTQGFKNDGISLSNSDYFEWGVTAAAGYEFSLSSIGATFKGTSTYAPASVNFAYSLDGGSTFTFVTDTPISVGSGLGGSSGTSISVDLSGISDLQGVDSVIFKFFASGSTATGGFGFYGSNALTINGVTALAIPEPSTYALLGAGAGILILAQLRRKKA